MPTAVPKAAPRLWTRVVLVVLLALGVVALSLCHTDAVPHGRTVASVAASGHGGEETASSASSAAHDHEEHCDEAGSVLVDQRTGSLSASVLLGMGVFAFVGLPVPAPTSRPLPRSARRRRTLPLGGTRALVSLCVRRV
ncbi:MULTISPECIES: hypothetical protein [unclassified Nocardiopsis]|uniref:hypothetical protein n=1 Tax=unclassified Nocardiopsis TaxID=2649073 RepID=UPI001161174D|nr:hypothetical protein [Nocardiopsis sp. TSRI0078]